LSGTTEFSDLDFESVVIANAPTEKTVRIAKRINFFIF
jgi:hypothetical protein